MTQTRRWLATRRRELLLLQALGAGLGTAGCVLALFALGVMLSRLGVYRHMPDLVLAVWLGAAAAAVAGASGLRRLVIRLDVASLARAVEDTAGTRAGWVAGAAAEGMSGSEELAGYADRQVAEWLGREGMLAVAPRRRLARRGLAVGTILLAAGAALLAVTRPAAGAGRDFWQPLGVVLRARAAVELSVDRTMVQRGDTVRLVVRAPGRARATLLIRALGEEWGERRLALDSAGAASVLLGPLDSDRYVRAVSGGRESETIHVEVSLPVLLATIELTARFPTYLDRPDEFLAPDGDTLWLPAGTRLDVRGRITTSLGAAAWMSRSDTVPLEVSGDTFSGSLRVMRDARWRLDAVSQEGAPLVRPPLLSVIVVPDSMPAVTVPVPGADTVAPFTLRQGLLIDARDDHAVSSLELVSWRVTRRGERLPPTTVALPVPDDGMQHVLLSWLLDLNDRGFVPGDTALYFVRASDNAPNSNVGESPVYALRLPAVSELRQELREASRAVQSGADSLAAVQRELARRMQDLAAERDRSVEAESGGHQGAEQMPFDAAERARAVLEDEEQVVQRARQLDEELRALAEAAWTAGLADPAFHRQLQEIRDLLDRAMTDELEASLQALREALDRLDPADTRDALRRLSEAAAQLRDELARGRELFERAAVEGDLATLSSDADELAQRQHEWNAAVETADSVAAAREERDLAGKAEALARELARLADTVDSLGGDPEHVAAAGADARAAEQAMQRAAGEVRLGQRADARRSGERASASLDPMGTTLRRAQDELRREWRQEVMAELDRALVETADLARRQERLAGRMQRGESGPAVRAEQAAVREGVERVAQRLQDAAGKNALVSPRLAASLGLAQHRIDESLERLQRAVPITGEAAGLAGEAVDALNAAVFAMVQSRSDVASAESGSGLAEAMERMAELAQQQGALNGQAGGLMPMMEAGGADLLQQIQALAARQRALAQGLERLEAGGDVSGAGELANEAEELARALDDGRLDHDVVDRQEQLYRRLLDAGRSLESDEEDERRERVSETARAGTAPPSISVDVPGGTPRYPYPTWEALSALSPEQRRLVLEYFRRLNRAPQ
jgi:hypothetical protein